MGHWHILQSRSGNCVPTCFAMVARRCGITFDDHQGEDTGPGSGDLFLFSAPELQTKRFVPEVEEAGLAQIRVALSQPAWVLATVCGPLWVSVTRPLEHPEFGPLCPAGLWGTPFHCVIITGEVADGFLVLDPYLPSTDQPLTVTAEDLMRCIAGQALAVALPG